MRVQTPKRVLVMAWSDSIDEDGTKAAVVEVEGMSPMVLLPGDHFEWNTPGSDQVFVIALKAKPIEPVLTTIDKLMAYLQAEGFAVTRPQVLKASRILHGADE